ncbi:MAG TPA: hypothetical protein VGF86_15940 [Candidatus Tumulicola sp.]
MSYRSICRWVFWLFAGTAIFAGCSAARIPVEPAGPAQAVQTVAEAQKLPSELLYVFGGRPKIKKPYIMVFDGQDKSRYPLPLYTIPPDGNGIYGLLAVDRHNYLFAEQFFANSAKLYMFAPGQTKPSVTCSLPSAASAMYVSNGTLYLAQVGNAIVELAEPLTSRDDCSHPLATLTDVHAQREGSTTLYALVTDPQGDIFDTYQGGRYNYFYMDRFLAGSKTARPFANLHDAAATFYATSDRNDNLITNLADYPSGQGDVLAVFPHGSKVPKLFHPIDDGAYCGVAIATNDTELFALKNYPSPSVYVYRYDAKHGKIGQVKRSFSGLWMYGQSIAVYSR